MFFTTIQAYCLSKAGVEETFPFDDKTVVWKVMGKMFCLGDIEDFKVIALKCNPERSIRLREEFEQIKPGYHMNKKLWNSVFLEGLSVELVYELIDHSYDLVVAKLTKSLKTQLKELEEI